MSRKYKFHEPDGMYFVTCVVVDWIDVFTRSKYKNIIIESLEYCQNKKGLILHAYVIMTNHLHMIISRRGEKWNLSDILRDFKKFTAMQIIKAISENPKESRKDWMLQTFRKHGHKNSLNIVYQFW